MDVWPPLRPQVVTLCWHLWAVRLSSLAGEQRRVIISRAWSATPTLPGGGAGRGGRPGAGRESFATGQGGGERRRRTSWRGMQEEEEEKEKKEELEGGRPGPASQSQNSREEIAERGYPNGRRRDEFR